MAFALCWRVPATCDNQELLEEVPDGGGWCGCELLREQEVAVGAVLQVVRLLKMICVRLDSSNHIDSDNRPPGGPASALSWGDIRRGGWCQAHRQG